MPTSVQEIRPAAHAGTLYPADRDFLAKVVDNYCRVVDEAPDEHPKAIIAPHGGFVYSGSTAGSAYRGWTENKEVRRVVLIGPSHTFDFPGVALPDTTVFVTPLGELQVDRETAEKLEKFSFVRRFEAAHHPEHSIEVQLPFVQRLFGGVAIVPLVTGRVDSKQVSALIDSVWGGAETVFVISSDLSHHQSFETALKMDQSTARAIQEFRYAVITVDQACGYRAIRGFLQAAIKREMRCVLKDLKNSGETGPENEVTGYGAFQFFEL